MRVTVEQLRKWLEQFPADATVYGYEGEITGIVVSKDHEQLGYIEADEDEGPRSS